MFESVCADIRRATAQEAGLAGKVALFLFHPGLQATLFYRLARWLLLHHMSPLAVVTSYLSSVLTGAQISPRAVIGKGLRIYHPQGVVIGAGAVVGDYCTLSHGNMIGTFGEGERPVIGHRFSAATGAKVLGKITVGNNVRVGPNSVVIISVPDDVVMVGVPARILLREECGATLHPTIRGALRGETVERLINLLRKNVEAVPLPEIIEASTGLLGEGIGLDSVEILKLVCAIEEEFGLTIDESELTAVRFKTVASLAAFVEEKSAR
ncbi:MAG: phosphopantetheine-binding protein [bacterium]